MSNLYCHYTATTVLQIEGDTVVDEKQLPKVTWPWGPIKGGTGWMPMGQDLMRFFHSSLDYDLPPNRRRYYLGAITSRGQISRKPIAIGSESDDVPRDRRDTCLHFKPKVVFPGGAMEWNGGWLVSVGANDCECLLLKVKPEDLHL